MPNSNQTANFAATIAAALPYLRRYARALTGAQSTGDKYAASTLEAMIAEPGFAGTSTSPKLALFAAFHKIWTRTGSATTDAETVLEQRAQKHMKALTNNTREAILLHIIEGFNHGDIATIMTVTPDEAAEFIAIAQREMANSLCGKIMLIEDEAIIAMDLKSILTEMGHSATGIARTRKAAVALSQKDRPDLILADIQLADNSSGIDAVADILEALGDIPVIFITAFPERLLTGKRQEPAFLISKPYSEEQVRLAVSQAMFFASTETLTA